MWHKGRNKFPFRKKCIFFFGSPRISCHVGRHLWIQTRCHVLQGWSLFGSLDIFSRMLSRIHYTFTRRSNYIRRTATACEKYQTCLIHAAAVACVGNCVAVLRTRRNQRDLNSIKAHANGRNKCQQQLPTLLWFHANGRNNSQHCWAQRCWVLLANNVVSVCMGLKVWPVSSNYMQQVPTLLWFHANGRNKSQHCWAQQCWVLLANMMLGLFVWALMYQRNFAWSYMLTCTSKSETRHTFSFRFVTCLWW